MMGGRIIGVGGQPHAGGLGARSKNNRLPNLGPLSNNTLLLELPYCAAVLLWGVSRTPADLSLKF